MQQRLPGGYLFTIYRNTNGITIHLTHRPKRRPIKHTSTNRRANVSTHPKKDHSLTFALIMAIVALLLVAIMRYLGIA